MGALQVFVVRFFFQASTVRPGSHALPLTSATGRQKRLCVDIYSTTESWYRYSLVAAAAYRKHGIGSGHDAHEYLYYT